MNITIYYRDEDDNYQKVTVLESEALNKIRDLLNDGGNLITSVSLPFFDIPCQP